MPWWLWLGCMKDAWSGATASVVGMVPACKKKKPLKKWIIPCPLPSFIHLAVESSGCISAKSCSFSSFARKARSWLESPLHPTEASLGNDIKYHDTGNKISKHQKMSLLRGAAVPVGVWGDCHHPAEEHGAGLRGNHHPPAKTHHIRIYYRVILSDSLLSSLIITPGDDVYLAWKRGIC